MKAGIAIIYERKDGTRVVADGHQRLGLAKRVAALGQKPRIIGHLMREVDGFSIGDVREAAAAKNIAEGTGDAFDAATVLRESKDPGKVLEGLPPQSSLVRNARDIARLEEDPFAVAKAAKLPAEHVAVVGRLAEGDGPLQEALVKEFAGQKPSNTTQAEALVRMFREDRAGNESVADLFGEQEVATSFYRERAKIIDGTIKRLRLDKRVFATLDRHAKTIEEAGNVLAGENVAISEAAGRAAFLVQQLATRAGPVSSAVKVAAEEVHEGRANYQTAISAVIGSVKEWATTGGDEVGLASGRPRAPVGEGRDIGEDVPGRGEETPRADEDVDREPTAAELEAAGQSIMFQRGPAQPRLRATHNLSEANVLKALDRGTLVAPSVAVTPSDVPHAWGGQRGVDLVFRAGAIDPKRWIPSGLHRSGRGL